MKGAKKYLFFLFLIVVIFYSCKKDTPTPPNHINTPRDTFGYNNFIFWEYQLSANDMNYKNGVLNLTVSYWGGSETITYIYFSIHAKQTGVYLLSNKDTGKFGTIFDADIRHWWFTDSKDTGKVTLTELDTINHIASGTFWYTAKLGQGDTAFVMPYTSVDNGFFTLNW